MLYSIKEIFLTIQGEGFNSGRTAIFCRFSGCNLWNGKEESRNNAICKFCDTDFIGTKGINGGKYKIPELVRKLNSLWPYKKNDKFIVLTGGEPLLQLNKPLIQELKKNKFYIAIETNGTILPPQGIDWICMSPKKGTKILLEKGNEIKIVTPQKALNPSDFENLDFDHYFIQPLYDKNIKKNTEEAIKFVINNPKWKLSIQSHKYLNIM